MRRGEAHVMKAPRSMFLLAYGSLIFWIALIVLSTIYPGRTPPHEMVWVRITFGFFGLLSLILIYYSHVCEIVWDEQCISGPNWYGKRLHFQWADVLNVKYSPSMQSMHVVTRTQTIWVPETWQGVEEFIIALKRLCPHAVVLTMPEVQHLLRKETDF